MTSHSTQVLAYDIQWDLECDGSLEDVVHPPHMVLLDVSDHGELLGSLEDVVMTLLGELHDFSVLSTKIKVIRD
jgi:hypothetical protein